LQFLKERAGDGWPKSSDTTDSAQLAAELATLVSEILMDYGSGGISFERAMRLVGVLGSRPYRENRGRSEATRVALLGVASDLALRMPEPPARSRSSRRTPASVVSVAGALMESLAGGDLCWTSEQAAAQVGALLWNNGVLSRELSIDQLVEWRAEYRKKIGKARGRGRPRKNNPV